MSTVVNRIVDSHTHLYPIYPLYSLFFFSMPVYVQTAVLQYGDTVRDEVCAHSQNKKKEWKKNNLLCAFRTCCTILYTNSISIYVKIACTAHTHQTHTPQYVRIHQIQYHYISYIWVNLKCILAIQVLGENFLTNDSFNFVFIVNVVGRFIVLLNAYIHTNICIYVELRFSVSKLIALESRIVLDGFEACSSTTRVHISWTLYVSIVRTYSHLYVSAICLLFFSRLAGELNEKIKLIIDLVNCVFNTLDVIHEPITRMNKRLKRFAEKTNEWWLSSEMLW